MQQLARHARPAPAQPAVEQVDADVGDRPADGQRSAPPASAATGQAGGVDRRLGGPVEVAEPRRPGARSAGRPAPAAAPRRRRTPAQDEPPAGLGEPSSRQRAEVRGNELEDRDPALRRARGAGRPPSWSPPGRARTSRAPANSGRKISQTEASKLNGVFWSTASPGPSAKASCIQSSRLTIAAVAAQRPPWAGRWSPRCRSRRRGFRGRAPGRGSSVPTAAISSSQPHPGDTAAGARAPRGLACGDQHRAGRRPRHEGQPLAG